MRSWIGRWLLVVLLGLAPLEAAASESPRADLVRLLTSEQPAAEAALDALVARGDDDIVAGLILARRYRRDLEEALDAALAELTGADAGSWFDWMLWLQLQDGLLAHPAVFTAQRLVLQSLDPRFLAFLPEDVAHDIRLEEIVWGGVRVDGIPALDQPAFIAADEASYLAPEDKVFGVAINGDVRAYPLRILDWHEMANDVVGGVPVSLTYCTLCGAAILFEGRVEGRATPFTFGSSGLLYRSNKLMYDRETGSLWNQFTGRPVVGPLTGSDITLDLLPIELTSWADWRARHPGTRVLDLETGHRRDYRPGAAYGDYFASTELMFPAVVANRSLAAKDQVFGVRTTGGAKAWPLALFAGGALVQDRVGFVDVLLIGDAESRSVRAYERRGQNFQSQGDGRLLAGDVAFAVTDDALVGTDGTSLPRLAGHVAYWFAFAGFLDGTTLYDPASDPPPVPFPG